MPARKTVFLTLLVAFALPLLPSAAGAGEPIFRDVFTSGKEGYHTFRIPALIVTPGGTLLAFCEGRKTSRSDHGDLDLVLERSTDGGKTWGPLELVYEEGGTKKITIGNPCPVVDESTGVLWLPFCRDNDDVLVMSSKDEGKTWSKPVDITAKVKKKGWTWYATGPGVGIQLRHGPHKGRLLIPCDHRERAAGGEAKYSHAFYSDDHGKTWQLGENVGLDTNECQAVELADGTVMMNMRNYDPRHKGQRAVALSKDGGRTWGALSYDEVLIEPVCQASFLRYTGAGRGKDRILFSNPASKRSRDHLTVRLSYDEGKTWPVGRVLHAGPSAYSCLTVLPDRSIGCLYEAGKKSAYETIRFARLDLEWLTGGKDALKPKE